MGKNQPIPVSAGEWTPQKIMGMNPGQGQQPPYMPQVPGPEKERTAGRRPATGGCLS